MLSLLSGCVSASGWLSGIFLSDWDDCDDVGCVRQLASFLTRFTSLRLMSMLVGVVGLCDANRPAINRTNKYSNPSANNP